MAKPNTKTDAEWKKELTPEQYQVMRKKDTEPPFSSKYLKMNDEGMFVCAACGVELFPTDTKFDSGTGWPSFFAPASNKNITLRPDTTLGMKRTEVLCAHCDSHLGHLFPDGPKPTGQRFCVNGVALKFKKQS